MKVGPVGRSGKTGEALMRLAIRKAREGIDAGQTPFGACIVRDGEVVSCAHNQVWQAMDITCHAEMVAIREACRKLKTVELSGCEIYSTCEPCPMCFSACHWAKLARVVYGARIADAQTLGFSELTIPNHHMKQVGGSPLSLVPDFLRDECLDLFRLWASRPDAKPY